MGIIYNLNTKSCKTALELLQKYPNLQNKDGYYLLYPRGNTENGELVYCDMTTDGGGWMLIARSHPTSSGINGGEWGWLGDTKNKVNDFTAPYQAGWYTKWHKTNNKFSSWLVGNRANINNNKWGSFIFKRSGFTYDNIINSDTQQTATTECLKWDYTVYGSQGAGMQQAIGFALTGTTNNIYYMRDCCGFAGYGCTPTGMSSTYFGHESVVYYSGPWGGGSNIDSNGNFLSGSWTTPTYNYVYGGTNQYLLMVR